MGASINIEDLTADQRRALKLRKPRQTRFSAEQVRTWALRSLAPLAGLTREQRQRVLRHALRMNRI